jgi:hypothetical protein
MNSNPVISRIGFRLLRYFSTVLIPKLSSGLETRPESFRDSNSRGCGRSISLRTVTEKSLMALKPFLLIKTFISGFWMNTCVLSLTVLYIVIAKDKVLKQSQIDSFKGIHK